MGRKTYSARAGRYRPHGQVTDWSWLLEYLRWQYASKPNQKENR